MNIGYLTRPCQISVSKGKSPLKSRPLGAIQMRLLVVQYYFTVMKEITELLLVVDCLMVPSNMCATLLVHELTGETLHL